MRLLSAAPSPFARKVRVALAEKRIPFELVTEVPWNPGAEAARLNPLGKVPVLLLDDGEALFDSRFILEWLEAKHPEPPLLPPGVDERLRAKQLEVLADGVCDAVVLIFLERQRPPGRHSEAWVERQMRKVEAGTESVAGRVAGQPFASGERFGLADIAVGSMLGYLDLRLPEFPWRVRHPGLAALMGRLSERPSFQATAPAPQTLDAGVV